MTWASAVVKVNQEIKCLVSYYKEKIPTHPAPEVLALRVLLARERSRFLNAKKGA